MNSEDIDKIIAEAVEDSKKKSRSKWRRPNGSSNSILTARKIINWVFMIAVVAVFIIYFVWPEQKVLFFSVGFGAMLLKLIEFYLRFMF